MHRKTKTGWSVRVRIGSAGRPWLPMPAVTETQRLDRERRLQRLAEEFVRAGKADLAERALRQCAEQQSPKAFDAAERAARRALTEEAPEAAPRIRTFRDVCELWTSGELHRLYPEDVEAKTDEGRKSDRTILSAFYPLLGNKLLAEITKDDTDKAKLLVPASVKAASTRALYLTRLRKVFKLARDPLGLIDTLPLRGSFVPSRIEGRDFWYLYPAEARLLIACVEIPFEYRFLYGFLLHNGTRIGETLKLTWAHIDWERGVVRLEKSWTKTRRGRTWKLDPDVLRALRRRWDDLGKPEATPVFVRANGKPIIAKRVAERFVSDLRVAGITRPELLASTEDGRQLRPHDLRATFVTIARKVGRRMADGIEVVMTDRWIMDRTGHETLGVLGKYERMVRHATELDLGWFAPLDETLYPEASGPRVAKGKVDQRVDQKLENLDELAVSANPTWSISGSLPRAEEPNPAAAARSDNAKTPLGPPGSGGVDQNRRADLLRAQKGLTDAQLQELLELAHKSKRWHLVTALGTELDARAAAAPSNVTRLDERRRGR